VASKIDEQNMKQPHSQTLLVIPVLALCLSGCAQRVVLHDDKSDHDSSKITKIDAKSSTGYLGAAETGGGPDNVRIWFLREEGGELRPTAVERSVSSANLIQAATDQLLRGPTPEERQAGIQSEIPLGTVLIGVKGTGKDPVAELNLSQRFTSGGESSMEARLSQLERTLKDAAGKTKVFLDVEGHRLLTAGEGLEVKQPLNE
jgi:spore germination protein GerM